MITLEDEFLAYLKAKIKDHLIMSINDTDFLLWGARKNNEVKLLGLALNVGARTAVALDADRWIAYHCVVTEECKVLKLADE